MAVNGRGRPSKAQAEERAKITKWLTCINDYEKEFEPWTRRVESILKRYKDEGRKDVTNPSAKFNILWSNVQTLIPATFSRLPQPDVSRRFRDNDPVGRVAGMILERGLDYEVQHYPDYRATMTESVQDRFLGGRGTSWVRYEPHMRAKQLGLPEDGQSPNEDGDQPEESLDYECAPTDYVHWQDFGHTKARTWEEVTGVWRRVFLTRAACIERFGELGEKIPLDSAPADKPGSYQATGAEDKSRACIYEIWDKHGLEALWISKSLNQVLDTVTPADEEKWLKLEGFFPCPKPLYATLTTDSLVPTPDFALYQDQANTLDVLCDRIDGLVKMLQVKGTFDASVPELARLFTEGQNGTLIGVKNWAAYAEKNGLKGSVDVYDLTPIFNALREAYPAMQQQKEQIYEITGISDIIRGQSDSSETLGAQEIKRSFAGLRLGSYKESVALYATELLMLKAQVICSKFDDETIMKIGGVDQLSPEDQALVPQAIALLKNEPLRNFRIEIAADTLVQMDEQQEQEARVQFLGAVGVYIEKAVAALTMAGPMAPALAPMVMDLLKFGVTGFKIGKQVEGSIDQAADAIKKLAANPPPPPPDPAVAKAQADAQARQQELVAEQQAEQQRLGMESQAERERMAMESQAENRRLEMEAAAEERRMEREAMIAQMTAVFDERTAKMQADAQAQTALLKAHIDARAKVEVANISAQASVEAAENRPAPGGE